MQDSSGSPPQRPDLCDTGLVNNRTYYYRVETIGHYDGDALPGPLLNWSRRACANTFDYTRLPA